MTKHSVTWANNGVRFSTNYQTDYHAEQFARALQAGKCTDITVHSKKIETIKVREDLRGQELYLPLEDGRYVSTEDARAFETLHYEGDDEFNLPICLDGVWTRALSIDFE